MRTGKATAEVELKLAIDPAAVAATVAAVQRHPAVLAHAGGRWRSAQVCSTYYDTPDWRLADAGVALRLRRHGPRWLQTVKGPPLAEAGGGLHARAEHEWPVAGQALDTSRLATTPWRKLLGKAIAGEQLAARFTTEFRRRTNALVYPDGTRAELCIDTGEIRAALLPRPGQGSIQARAVIAEIEIELETGDIAHLYALASALTRDLPLTVAIASKADRGFQLAHGQPDGWHLPRRAQSVSLAPQAPAPQALCAIARECLQQVAANAAGLRADDDPEWVHQMRIGTRRLRSCLALATRYFPRESVDPLMSELKWLAGVLGSARDWDVFATETLPPFAAQLPADLALAPNMRRLQTGVRRRRSAARAAARAAVRSARFQQLVLGVGAFCSRSARDALRPAGSTVTADIPIARRFARKLLERRHRRLLQRADACTPGTPEERHALRIAAKKLRYAAEFFAPVLQRKHVRAYVRALANLQEALGHGNDATTAARLARLVAPKAHDPAAAALHGWIAAQAAAALPLLAPAWAGFARTRRFWDG